MVKTFVIIVMMSSCAWALSVSPGRTELRLEPGQSAKSALLVTNDLNQVLHIEVSEKSWFVLPENKAFSIDEWLKVKGSRRFDLKPGQSRTVAVRVTCPKGSQGEFVGMVSFEYVTDQPSMVTPMISVSTYLAVAGTEKISGEIAELGVRRWHDKLQAAVAVKSTGNVHLRPSGALVLTDEKGQEVAHYKVAEGNPVYPGQVQGYVGQGADVVLPPGHYDLKADLRYGEFRLAGSRGFSVAQSGEIQMNPVK